MAPPAGKCCYCYLELVQRSHGEQIDSIHDTWPIHLSSMYPLQQYLKIELIKKRLYFKVKYVSLTNTVHSVLCLWILYKKALKKGNTMQNYYFDNKMHEMGAFKCKVHFLCSSILKLNAYLLKHKMYWR